MDEVDHINLVSGQRLEHLSKIYAPLNTTGRMLLHYLQPSKGHSLKRFGVVLCIKTN